MVNNMSEHPSAGSASSQYTTFRDRAHLLGDRNLADYLKHCASSARGGHVDDTEQALYFAGGHNYPGAFTNGVIRRSEQLSAEQLLDRSEKFFGELRRSFLVWVREHADNDLDEVLLARNYTIRPPAEGLTGIAHDRAPAPSARALPAGYQLREVSDDAGFVDYLDVVGEAWHLPGAPIPVLESVLFSVSSLRADAVRVFVVYRGARAVAGCSVFLTAECGGLQWAGTRTEALGLGLGQASFRAAWQAAFDGGASLVVAQASGIGTPLWLSMGFHEVTRYRRYISPPVVRR